MPFNQLQLNDQVRDLYLPKHSAELLDHDCKKRIFFNQAPVYILLEEELLKYFTFDGLVFYNDIHHHLLDVGLLEYKPEEGKLFIDSSKQTVNAFYFTMETSLTQFQLNTPQF